MVGPWPLAAAGAGDGDGMGQKRREKVPYLVAALAAAAALWPIAFAAAQAPQAGQAPIAAFKTIPIDPWYSDPVTFDASASSDADGNIIRYAWDFGDGQNAVGVVVDHKYKQQANYTVTLTVTDNDGLANTLQIQIPVIDAPR